MFKGCQAVFALLLAGLMCGACNPRFPELEYPGVTCVHPSRTPFLQNPLWSPDGSMLAVTNQVSGEQIPVGKIYLLDVATGSLDLLLKTDYGFRTAQTWSPDGQKLIFSASLDYEGLWVIDVKEEAAPRFLSSGQEAAWSPGGEFIAIRDATYDKEMAIGEVSIRLLNYSTGVSQALFNQVAERASGRGLAWAPDGSRLAFALGAGSRDARFIPANIYVFDLMTDTLVQLTEGEDSSYPTWSPDGRLIAYIGKSAEHEASIFIMPAEGGCRIQPLDINGYFFGLNWSPDGKQIAFEWKGGIYAMDIAAVFGPDFLMTGPVCP